MYRLAERMYLDEPRDDLRTLLRHLPIQADLLFTSGG
ncbi:hypothetical protein B0G73_11039 [Paraburkholderia sp. BL25I1N1]|nr:hypothetical protein B0G73_11039 [Paraburkholderia sp. BL25I1N1]